MKESSKALEAASELDSRAVMDRMNRAVEKVTAAVAFLVAGRKEEAQRAAQEAIAILEAPAKLRLDS